MADPIHDHCRVVGCACGGAARAAAARTADQTDLTPAEKAAAERDAALARVAELEGQLAVARSAITDRIAELKRIEDGRAMRVLNPAPTLPGQTSLLDHLETAS